MISIEETEQSGRKTGIDILGDAPWGTHFCLFYKTREDLIDILVPYFKAGLENNEFCMWVTSEPLNKKEAEKALREAVPNFDEHLKKGQIEILPYNRWYLKDGAFSLQRVLNAYVDQLNQALAKGYAGIRVTGDGSGFEKRVWREFADYEKEVNKVIGKYRIVAICSYCLDKCGASEIIDVVNSHQFALIRRQGKWESIESSEHKEAQRKLLDYQKRLRDLASEISLTEERERRRIAIGLHDHITQNLILFKINVGLLRENKLPAESIKLLDKIYELIDQIIQNTRSLTFDLGSPTLYELGLEAAVREWLSEEIQQKHSIKTKFESDAQPKPLDNDICILLYRAIRELLINVVKHAQAQYVKVSICRDNSKIRINVIDDGVGFKLLAEDFGSNKRGGFGLFSIRERLSHFGGGVEIESKPNQGTQVTLVAPIKCGKTDSIGG